MAAIYLPPPGTEFGSCIDEDCGHDHCKDLRKQARSICRICGKEIGFRQRYYRDGDSGDWFTLVHEICLLTEIENERKGG